MLVLSNGQIRPKLQGGYILVHIPPESEWRAVQARCRENPVTELRICLSSLVFPLKIELKKKTFNWYRIY